MNLDDVQREVAMWHYHNFPKGNSEHQLLVVAEEVGELAHAHVKGEQGIRHSPVEIHDKKIDAVGDIIIALMAYCNKEGLSLNRCLEKTWIRVQRRDWVEKPLTGGDLG